MAYRINVPSHDKGVSSVDGNTLGYTASDDGDRVVFTTPEGHRTTMGRTNLVFFTVSDPGRKTVIAHYENVQEKKYCCVTCNGFTFCGEAPCCGGPNGNDNCC